MTCSKRPVVWVLMSSALALGACGDGAPPQGKEAAPVAAKKPAAPLIAKTQIADWCKEHGVPESICTRCNDSLIEGYKKKGDWCKEHALPESQCFICHPELEAKFKAAAEAKAASGK